MSVMVVAKNRPRLVCFENHTMVSFVVLFLFIDLTEAELTALN